MKIRYARTGRGMCVRLLRERRFSDHSRLSKMYFYDVSSFVKQEMSQMYVADRFDAVKRVTAEAGKEKQRLLLTPARRPHHHQHYTNKPNTA